MAEYEAGSTSTDMAALPRPNRVLDPVLLSGEDIIIRRERDGLFRVVSKEDMTCEKKIRKMRETLWRESRALDILVEKQRFPYTYQVAAVAEVLGKRDVFIKAGTGMGKSFNYQLLALLRPTKVVLVISPLLALMDDQVRMNSPRSM